MKHQTIKTYRYNDFNSYLKERYGGRVHKITVDAGLSCPNRDGTLSHGGCIYCNAKGSGTGAAQKQLTIAEQINRSKPAVIKRYKAYQFIVYFQSYTNTYAPLHHLRHLYEDALSVDGVVGLAIGTRPDCVDKHVIDLLGSYTATHMIWIEYGLQSMHDATLALINRGHDCQSFKDAVTLTRKHPIHICAHVILGLPGETRQHMLETIQMLTDMAIDGIKLHLLYVIKGTPLDELYQKNGYRCLEQREYAELICDILERLPKRTIIQRLTSDPHPYELVAPQWALKKKETRDLIDGILEQRGSFQGTKVDAL